MSWAIVAVAAAGVVGGAMSSSAAKSAADKQVGAANRATDSQTGMFNQTVDMESPFRQAGVDSTQQLSYLLGTGGNQQFANPAANQEVTRLATQAAQARAVQQVASGWGIDPSQVMSRPDTAAEVTRLAGTPTPEDLATARSQVTTGWGNPASDPNYGSLLKPFGMDDFQLDPGIQYQMKYGQQALQNSQAAKNGVLSGGALKDLMGFNQDYAGLGYQSAYDRFMKNKSFTLGSLMDMSKMGQAAAGNTVNAAGSFSSGIAGTITGAGNAAAAGTIGSANALAGGVQGAGNAYFLSSLLNKNGGSSSGAPAGGVMSDDSIANYA